MGVKKYRTRRGTRWMVDATVVVDGKEVRIRRKGIPTREQAIKMETQVRKEAYDGEHFGVVIDRKMTVAQAWEFYSKVSERDHRSWKTEQGRFNKLARHLGSKQCSRLSQEHVDGYRNLRLEEKTVRGTPPSKSTLDREVELLKRIINYAVKCRRLKLNPIAGVKLLRAPNTRNRILADEEYDALLEVARPELKPFLVIGFHTGMRLSEIVNLRRTQVDLKSRVFRLGDQDTKTGKGRVVPLSDQVLEVLGEQPSYLNGWVLPNPETGKPYTDTAVRHWFNRACTDAKIVDRPWFHDLRRTFTTRMRRLGVPEGVIMRITGHKTRAVFDRYSIVEESDLRRAVEIYGTISSLSENPAPRRQRPHRLTTDGA